MGETNRWVGPGKWGRGSTRPVLIGAACLGVGPGIGVADNGGWAEMRAWG